MRRLEDGLTLPQGAPDERSLLSMAPNLGGLVGGIVGAGKGLLRMGEPETPAQQIGFAVERAGEFMAASGGAAALTGGASIPAQMAGQAGAAGLTMAAQGGDPADIGIAAGLGAAGPPAAATLNRVGSFINTRMTPRQVNSVLGIPKAALRNADDLGPGARLVDDGIKAAGKDSLMVQVQQNLDDAGQRIQAMLEKSRQTLPTQALDDIVLKPLDDAERAIRQSPEGFQTELGRIFDRIAERIPNRPMTPTEAFALKTEIGTGVRWTGASADHPANQALMRIYWRLTDAIGDMVPGVRAQQARWGDYFRAQRALDASIRARQVAPSISGQGIAANLQKVTRATPTMLPTVGLQRATRPSTREAMIEAAQATRAGLLSNRAQ
jgi:hypothetical protein